MNSIVKSRTTSPQTKNCELSFDMVDHGAIGGWEWKHCAALWTRAGDSFLHVRVSSKSDWNTDGDALLCLSSKVLTLKFFCLVTPLWSCAMECSSAQEITPATRVIGTQSMENTVMQGGLLGMGLFAFRLLP